MKRILLIFLMSIQAIFIFAKASTTIELGADRINDLKNIVKNQRVGLVVNQTSINNKNQHLIDVLIENKINVVKLFSPEHGIRGNVNAGDDINNSVDTKTQLPIISLYGNDELGSKRKLRAQDLKDIDVLIFDIQDVGARFYTYISTLFYVIESAAESNKKVVVLDRPNPNGHDVNGPIMEKPFESFVGIMPIPVSHGMTIGELAKMLNAEKWTKKSLPEKDLIVISMKNYNRNQPYSLPVSPSPNLKTDESIALYSSLALFEATTISVGRGTDEPFTIIGYPDQRLLKNYEFDVKDIAAAWPQRGAHCFGEKLTVKNQRKHFDISHFYDWYHKMKNLGFKDEQIIDRPEWLEKLIGTDQFYKQLKAGKSVNEIVQSWQPKLNEFKKKRENYLIYP